MVARPPGDWPAARRTPAEPLSRLAALERDGGALLSICSCSAEPLETVLDLLLDALGARFVLWAAVEPGEVFRAVARRPPGRSIARPERLLRPETAAEVRRHRRALLVDLPRSAGQGWLLGCPLPANGEPRRAVFAEGGGALSPELRDALPGAVARLAPWVALAGEIADLRSRNQALSELPSLAGPSGGEPSPAAEAGPPAPGEDPGCFPAMVASATAMRQVLRTVALVAASDAAVLLEGESGTGKELIARAIHQKSSRSRGPFVSENCAACPEQLLESEFFGVERGAFTGAHRTKAGLFERAHRGTLFLDEIGEMELGLQRKLLRALQEREVRRVGGGQAIPVDFRLICATNRVLADEARAGRFRADLLYRIEVVAIRVPPLRERREDIPRLVDLFLTRYASKAGFSPPPVNAAALRVLCDYLWPGNVRELENEMCRAIALGARAITPSVLSGKILRARREVQEWPRQIAGRTLEHVEREVLGGLIQEVLLETGGNKFRAAQILGIPKTSLYRRLRRYSIPFSARRIGEGRDSGGDGTVPEAAGGGNGVPR